MTVVAVSSRTTVPAGEEGQLPFAYLIVWDMFFFDRHSNRWFRYLLAFGSTLNTLQCSLANGVDLKVSRVPFLTQLQQIKGYR